MPPRAGCQRVSLTSGLDFLGFQKLADLGLGGPGSRLAAGVGEQVVAVAGYDDATLELHAGLLVEPGGLESGAERGTLLLADLDLDPPFVLG